MIKIITNEKLKNTFRKFKENLSPRKFKQIFFGTKKRIFVTLFIPASLVILILISPFLINQYYKRLLKSEDNQDFNKALNYFSFQKSVSGPDLISYYKKTNDNTVKVNIIKLLLQLNFESRELNHFIIEMLEQEPITSLKVLDSFNVQTNLSEEILNSLILNLKKTILI